SGFTLTLHENEPRFNPTLIEMLRQDFKLDLGVAEGELPTDESGLDISTIWKSVSSAIKEVKGWEVSEEVVLAMFSFAKYLMWKDLTERTDQLRANPVVRHLIDTPRDNYPSHVAFPNPRHLDRELAPEKTFCPLPADSSQLSAVLAAVRGKDFVLIGPPGTGKSQTIANLIAQCLAEGKRVLFVSEKIAALDVVYRRLREVGLGEFCLELHSSKARKLDVLAQLQKAWEAQGSIDSEVWLAEAQRLKRLRDELNRYVERLHHRHSNGMTVYEAIGRVVDGESVARLPLAWSSAEAHGTAAMEAMRDIADRLEVNAKAVGHAILQNHPLATVGQCDWSPTWQQSLVVATQSAVVASEAVEKAAQQFVHVTGLPSVPLTRRARGAIGVLARALPHVAGRDWRFVLRADAKSIGERLQMGVEALSRHRELTASLTPGWSDSVVATCRGGMKLLEERRTEFAQLGAPWPQDVVAELKRCLGLLDKIGQTQSGLSVKYADGIEQVNVSQLQRELSKAEKAMWPMSWLGKRKVKAALDAHVAGEGQPDVAKDIRALVRIRSLRSEVEAADVGPIGDGVWRGLKTKPEVALSALEFQQALEAARNECQWKDVGFEVVAGGRCGAALQDELGRMRALRALDERIDILNSVGATTGNVWVGRRTDIGILNAALSFNAASRAVAAEGALRGEHEVVASGRCGADMQADYERLQTRESVEQELNGLDDLRQMTAGLWNALRTRVEEVQGALKFQSAIATAVSNLATTPEELSSVKTVLERLIGDGNALLEPTGQIAGYGRAYRGV
ncbi:MAG: DNA helicase, partial [Pseudomonadota bacterium]|nr:DNA helicase [Pseudomonadota bacterium]